MTWKEDRNRILSIVPAKRGAAFTCLEEPDCLIDRGLIQVRPWNLAKLKERLQNLVERLEPEVVLVPAELDRRCGERARKTLAAAEQLPVTIIRARTEHGTRSHARATLMIERFPELRTLLPQKRGPWMAENERSRLFTALALVVGSPGIDSP